MTKKEAINLLRANVMVACDTSDKVGYGTPLNKAIEEALNMAIRALEQQPSDDEIWCPLVEIEPLTDSEQRIFLSAMSREERICKELDSEKVDDSTVKKLVPIVNSIERKVKKTLWG